MLSVIQDSILLCNIITKTEVGGSTMKKYYNISTFIIFGLLSIITTFYFPYLNQEIGLSLTDVGQVVSVGAFFTIIGQPMLTNFYSKVKNKKRFIITYLILVFFSVIALMFINIKTAIFYAPIYGFILGSLAGIFEIYIEDLAVNSGFEFSDIRKWGSIGYAVIVFISGIILNKLNYRFLHIFALILLILMMSIILLKFKSYARANTSKNTPSKIKAVTILRNKKLVLLFAVIALGMGSYMGLDFAYSTYLLDLTNDINKANNLYSMSVSFRVVVEFFSFMIVSKYANKLDSKKCLVTALVFASAKVILFSTGNVPLVILGDQLHGVLYGIYLTFLFKYIREIVESRLVAISFSILSVLSSGGANFIYPSIYTYIESKFGYFAMYLSGFIFIIISIIIFAIFLPNSKNKTIKS
jgi:MFS transporter, OHS family, lactose permease